MVESNLTKNPLSESLFNKTYSNNFKNRCIFIAVIFHALLFLLMLCPVIRGKTSYYYNLAVKPSAYSFKIARLSSLQVSSNSKKNATNNSNQQINQQQDKSSDDNDKSSSSNSSAVSYKIGSSNNPAPHYPRFAIENNMQGIVELFVKVDYGGKVNKISVFKPSGFTILDEAAINTVKHWVFEVKHNQQQYQQNEPTKSDKLYEVLVPIEFIIKQ